MKKLMIIALLGSSFVAHADFTYEAVDPVLIAYSAYKACMEGYTLRQQSTEKCDKLFAEFDGFMDKLNKDIAVHAQAEQETLKTVADLISQITKEANNKDAEDAIVTKVTIQEIINESNEDKDSNEKEQELVK